MSFETAFESTIGVEGRYANDPNDSGGETAYGITLEVARANGYSGPMIQLSLSQAQQIAKSQYWDLLRLDQIDILSPMIAAELFDSAYNVGAAQAGRWLQHTLNVFNHRQADYPDVLEDGLIGPRTLYALQRFLAKRKVDGESVFLKALNCLQGAFYISLSTTRPKDEDFVYGWIRTRIKI